MWPSLRILSGLIRCDICIYAYIFRATYLFVIGVWWKFFNIFSMLGLFTFSAWKLTAWQNENKNGHSTDRLARFIFGLAEGGDGMAISKALFDERTCTSLCLKAGQLTSDSAALLNGAYQALVESKCFLSTTVCNDTESLSGNIKKKTACRANKKARRFFPSIYGN